MGEKNDKWRDGAGFVLINKDTGLMLVLLREDGQYDLPKGIREDGESDIQCAIRECFEECSIVVDQKDVRPGYVTNGYLSIFLAYTDGIPHILPNQSTGILEHVGFRWVDAKDAVAGALDYLKPLIRSADSLK